MGGCGLAHQKLQIIKIILDDSGQDLVVKKRAHGQIECAKKIHRSDEAHQSRKNVGSMSLKKEVSWLQYIC